MRIRGGSMDVENVEIRNHMQGFPPFDALPDEVLDQVATQVEVTYYKAGSDILTVGDSVTDLFYIRSGAVELYRRSGELYNRLSEGSLFGQLSLLMDQTVRLPAVALEDTLLYCIPLEQFNELFRNHSVFADFVELEDRTRLRQAVSDTTSSNEALTSRIDRLISRPPVTIHYQATVRDAAGKMTENGVSALVIVDPSRSGAERTAIRNEGAEDAGPMAGIITDRDLRTRVIVEDLPYDTPIADVMTTNLITVRSDQYVFDAMLTMLHSNVHHLPVLRRNQPVGVIGISDIIQYESQNSLFVVRNIMRKKTVDELAAMTDSVHQSFRRMVHEDANSHMVGSAMAGIGRTFTQRLLEMAEEQLGPPPVPYHFLSLGSMAREEQLIVTDQDNALVLDNSFEPDKHDDYFKAMATIVSDGLAACGYTYCKGDIMATNPTWRQPLHVWESYFTEWIETHDAKALLNSSIFFDLGGIAGNSEFVERLRDVILDLAPKRPRFLGAMSRNALNRTPPLGFFKNFVMEKDGKHNNSINLKRRGTGPLSDLIRIHALACGSRAQNSFERLRDIEASGWLTSGIVTDLRDAMEFISMVRIRHQVRMMEAGETPNNNVTPENLSPFEQRNLKDAFQVLSNAQKFLRFCYPPDRG